MLTRKNIPVWIKHQRSSLQLSELKLTVWHAGCEWYRWKKHGVGPLVKYFASLAKLPQFRWSVITEINCTKERWCLIWVILRLLRRSTHVKQVLVLNKIHKTFQGGSWVVIKSSLLWSAHNYKFYLRSFVWQTELSYLLPVKLSGTWFSLQKWLWCKIPPIFEFIFYMRILIFFIHIQLDESLSFLKFLDISRNDDGCCLFFNAERSFKTFLQKITWNIDFICHRDLSAEQHSILVC